MALLAEERGEEVMVELDHRVPAKRSTHLLQQLADTGLADAPGHRLDGLVGLMGRAVFLSRIGDRVALVEGAFEHEALAAEHLEAMQELDRLLALDAGDDRSSG